MEVKSINFIPIFTFVHEKILNLKLAESDPELKNNIRNVVIDYPFYITPKCKDLLVKMLRVDPKERLSIDEVRLSLG